MQIKTISKNEFVGYNQTYKTNKKIRVAVLGIGYADGISRVLSNKGNVYFKKNTFKIVGRVSMDSITVDISKNSKSIKVVPIIGSPPIPMQVVCPIPSYVN